MNNVHLCVRLGLWAIQGIAAVPLAIITGEFSVLNWLSSWFLIRRNITQESKKKSL
jgi:hypothetical protein